jgi:hypothetical protein
VAGQQPDVKVQLWPLHNVLVQIRTADWRDATAALLLLLLLLLLLAVSGWESGTLRTGIADQVAAKTYNETNSITPAAELAFIAGNVKQRLQDTAQGWCTDCSLSGCRSVSCCLHHCNFS